MTILFLQRPLDTPDCQTQKWFGLRSNAIVLLDIRSMSACMGIHDLRLASRLGMRRIRSFQDQDLVGENVHAIVSAK